jgi:hypothetical protein
MIAFPSTMPTLRAARPDASNKTPTVSRTASLSDSRMTTLASRPRVDNTEGAPLVIRGAYRGETQESSGVGMKPSIRCQEVPEDISVCGSRDENTD